MPAADRIRRWLGLDDLRMQALVAAARLDLPDWALAAGFVRNLVWDRLHDKDVPTPLNDLDLVYYNADARGAAIDAALEEGLRVETGLPWSVKNQARMHRRNGHPPYESTQHAMSFWVELETAVGVRMQNGRNVEIVAPFGLERLFGGTITLNPARANEPEFRRRIAAKRWLDIWPKLRVVCAAD